MRRRHRRRPIRGGHIIAASHEVLDELFVAYV
jgi:hypothetical protein